jgi:hypothetical protein
MAPASLFFWIIYVVAYLGGKFPQTLNFAILTLVTANPGINWTIYTIESLIYIYYFSVLCYAWFTELLTFQALTEKINLTNSWIER